MTIISYSEVFKWQTCQRQYYYKFILRKSPIEESDAITTGNNGHKLLQNFYELLREGYDKEKALEAIRERAAKELKLDASLLKAWVLVDNYIRQTDFTSEAYLIENRFLIPATHLVDEPEYEDIQIGFTPDVVFQRKGNKLDIEDAKFVQRAWTKSKVNRFPQLKLYYIFMNRMGYDVSRCILRFFNVTRGDITTQNYVLPKAEENILLRDFMAGVREVYAYKTQSPEKLSLAPRTMAYTACQYCAFEFPCSLEAEGKDASRTLDTQYVESTYDYSK